MPRDPISDADAPAIDRGCVIGWARISRGCGGDLPPPLTASALLGKPWGAADVSGVTRADGGIDWGFGRNRGLGL